MSNTDFLTRCDMASFECKNKFSPGCAEDPKKIVFGSRTTTFNYTTECGSSNDSILLIFCVSDCF